MSWLYSRALVEAFSGGGCSDGAPSAPSSGNPTPQAYLPPDRMTAFSRPSRFGMTFAPLTDDHGAAVLTSFLAAFPARTSVWLAKAPALTEPDQACGPTWRASLARFDPATFSWKTAQRSLLADSDECSVIWPRSGMTAGGLCWELPTLERRTKETGSGLWLGTPTATMSIRSDRFKTPGMTPAEFVKAHPVKQWPTPTASQARSEGMILQMRNLVDAGVLDRAEAEAMMSGSLTPPRMEKWPTPRASETFQGYETLNALKDGNQSWMGSGRGATLTTAVMARNLWPMPIASDSRGSSGRSAPGKQVQLVDAVKFATPLSRDYRSGKASQATHDKNSRPLSEQIGGSLNPTWVEWLMGWPLGWTDLKPLATDKSHSAQQPHGGF